MIKTAPNSGRYQTSTPARDLLQRSTPATQQKRASEIVARFQGVSDTLLLANNSSADLNGSDLSKVSLKAYTTSSESSSLANTLKSGAGLLLNALSLGALGKSATPPNPLNAQAELSTDGQRVTSFEAQAQNPDSWATANLLAEPNSFQGPEMKFSTAANGSKSYLMRSPDSSGINRTEIVTEQNGLLRYTESYSSGNLLS